MSNDNTPKHKILIVSVVVDNLPALQSAVFDYVSVVEGDNILNLNDKLARMAAKAREITEIAPGYPQDVGEWPATMDAQDISPDGEKGWK